MYMLYVLTWDPSSIINFQKYSGILTIPLVPSKKTVLGETISFLTKKSTMIKFKNSIYIKKIDVSVYIYRIVSGSLCFQNYFESIICIRNGEPRQIFF
jgi:hypothetical protein